MTVLDEKERASLEKADDGLAKFQNAIELAAQNNALDAEALERFGATAREAVRRFKSNLPLEIDPVIANEINDRLIAILTPELDETRPLDTADAVIIEAEAIRHIVRDLLQEQPQADAREARECIALMEDWLPGLPAGDLAKLLGVSIRQLQRLRQTDRQSSHRTQLVTRLTAILRHAWTDEGVYAWFTRARQELGGSKPIELLDDADNERALMLAARAGRVQVAS